MTYEVRRPNLSDKPQLDELLIEDYRKSGVPKPPLTEAQVKRYANEAWIAVNESDEVEAITLAGDWKPGDAMPYLTQEERQGLRHKVARKIPGLFSKHRGIFLLSATDYEEDGPLATLVDDPRVRVLEPEKGGVVHVPLLRDELAAYAFLLGRGFEEGPKGTDMIFNQSVETVLMTRRAPAE